MNTDIIYKTVNLVNGKIYVGKHSQEVCPLVFDGYLGSGTVLKSAIRKYGKENFERITLETVSEEDINNREIFWIARLKSNDRNIGYNLTVGGEGFTSEDIRKRYLNEEYKQNHINKITERWKDPIYKQNHSVKMIEKWKDEEYRNKIIQSLKIVQNEPEFKENTRKQTTERWKNIEFRKQQSIVIKKSLNNPETHEKISIVSKKRWEDPEYKESQIQKMQDGISLEIKEKRSERLIERWKNPESREKLINSIKEFSNQPEYKLKQSERFLGEKSPLAKYHYVLKDPEGNLWETNCWREFARDHNLRQGSMVRMIKDSTKHTRGWYLVSRTLRDNMEVNK